MELSNRSCDSDAQRAPRGALGRVHVVDDEASVCVAVGRLLHAAGYTVQTFGSAREYLERVDPAEPDCVVLDLLMPGLDGHALQSALIERRCRTPIVFLTGYTDTDEERALKDGGHAFLRKPVDETELLAALASAIEASRVS